MPPPERTSAVFIPRSTIKVYHFMEFDPTKYGPEVSRIPAWDGSGQRLGPLVCGPCSSAEARRQLAAKEPADLFPGVREPEAATAGLWLYFSCFEEAHSLIDNPKTSD